jgi:hypothetical protein
MYGLPIKKIQFHTEHNHDLVLSMDAQVCTQTYVPTSVPDPWHFGVDPDPDPWIHASD